MHQHGQLTIFLHVCTVIVFSTSLMLVCIPSLPFWWMKFNKIIKKKHGCQNATNSYKIIVCLTPVKLANFRLWEMAKQQKYIFKT